MKKIILTILTFVLLIGTVDAKKITIIRHGGDDGKYDKVEEYHTLFEDKLTCKQPGSTGCGWVAVTSPTIGGEDSKLIELFVESRIENAENTGDVNYNGNVHVTWSYDPETDDLIITMDDGED